MQKKPYLELSDNILKDIFDKEELPKNAASVLPLFNELYLDLLKVMLKMKSITEAVYDQFIYIVADEAYHFTFSLKRSTFQSTSDAPSIIMVSSITFACEKENLHVNEQMTDKLITEAILAFKEAKLNFGKYKSKASKTVKRVIEHLLLDSDHEYYIGPREIQQEVWKMQKVQFTVVRKLRQKFFAIFLYTKEEVYESTEKLLDYGVYFSFLNVNILPDKGITTIYRNNEILDAATVQLKQEPGERGSEFYPVFAFSNSKVYGTYQHSVLPVNSLKEGDIVEINWELTNEEMSDIQWYLNHKDVAGSITPEQIPAEVRRCFVNRVVLKNREKSAISPFSLFFATLPLGK